MNTTNLSIAKTSSFLSFIGNSETLKIFQKNGIKFTNERFESVNNEIKSNFKNCIESADLNNIFTVFQNNKLENIAKIIKIVKYNPKSKSKNFVFYVEIIFVGPIMIKNNDYENIVLKKDNQYYIAYEFFSNFFKAEYVNQNIAFIDLKNLSTENYKEIKEAYEVQKNAQIELFGDRNHIFFKLKADKYVFEKIKQLVVLRKIANSVLNKFLYSIYDIKYSYVKYTEAVNFKSYFLKLWDKDHFKSDYTKNLIVIISNYLKINKYNEKNNENDIAIKSTVDISKAKNNFINSLIIKITGLLFSFGLMLMNTNIAKIKFLNFLNENIITYVYLSAFLLAILIFLYLILKQLYPIIFFKIKNKLNYKKTINPLLKLTNIKVVFCDLDGTLLDENKKISDNNVKIINRLSKHLKFKIMTGRNYDFIPKNLSQFDGIFADGSLIKINDETKILGILQENIFKNIYNLCDKYQFSFVLQTKNGSFYQKYRESNYFIKNKNILVNKYNPKNNYKNILKIHILIENNNELNILREINDLKIKNNYSFNITNSDDNTIDILPLNIDKSVAIQKFLFDNNINPNNVIIFGDNNNDFAVFEWAKNNKATTVAVDNAVDKLKQIASYLTYSNNKNGVLWFLDNCVIDDNLKN